GIAYEVILHDYFLTCRRIDLIDRHRRYCGLASAETCRACLGPLAQAVDPGVWRERSRVLLAEATRIVAPSADLADRIAAAFPGIRPEVFEPEDDTLWPAETRPAIAAGEALRLAVIGSLNVPKGFDVLARLARTIARRGVPIEITVLGTAVDAAALRRHGAPATGRTPRFSRRSGRRRGRSCSRPRVIGAEPRAASRSGGLAAAADEVGEAGHRRGAGGTEPGAEIVPEREAELLAGLAEAEEGVAAVAAGAGLGAAADLAFGHLAADVVLRTIGVQRDLRVVEHHQELGLVGVQPLEQAVEGGKAGGAQEDAVEARPHFAAAARRRCQAIGLEVGVVPPDQPADMLLGGALLVGERLQLVHQALGMDPAQAMLADIELPGVVA